MRVEPDRQGHHSSEAPACHRCGIPLLADATYCPYCERALDDAETLAPARVAAPSVRTRTFLGVGVVFFAVLAFACLATAFII